MDTYYTDHEPLACGHFAHGDSVWFATLPGITGGTACMADAIATENAGGTASMIPTNDQLLDWLDYERAGIGIN